MQENDPGPGDDGGKTDEPPTDDGDDAADSQPSRDPFERADRMDSLNRQERLEAKERAERDAYAVSESERGRGDSSSVGRAGYSRSEPGATPARNALEAAAKGALTRDLFRDACDAARDPRNAGPDIASSVQQEFTFGYKGDYFQFGDQKALDIYNRLPDDRAPRLDTSFIKIANFAAARGFYVTSLIDEGKHNAKSRHYIGRAVDTRVWHTTEGQDARGRRTEQIQGIPQEKLDAFMMEARELGISVRDETLKPNGQKVWKGAHIHLETPTREGNFEMNDCVVSGSEVIRNPAFVYRPWWKD